MGVHKLKAIERPALFNKLFFSEGLECSSYENSHGTGFYKVFNRRSKESYQLSRNSVFLTPYECIAWRASSSRQKNRNKGFGECYPRGGREDFIANLKPFPEVCPLIGVPLVYERVILPRIQKGKFGQKYDHSPSIDRIDNTKGYSNDNIRIVSWLANKAKGEMSLKQFYSMAEYMVEHKD